MASLSAFAAKHGARLVVERRRTDARRQLVEYLAGKRQRFDLELRMLGTEFQLRAWEALCTIGYGQRCSYGEQATLLGMDGGARAVGQANANNPIALVVPCHRLTGERGSLTGFGGGLPLKKWLLELEARPEQPPSWIPERPGAQPTKRQLDLFA